MTRSTAPIARTAQQTASQAYAQAATEAFEIIDGLAVDIRAAAVDCKTAHWGHIGDMHRAAALARELQALLRGHAG